MAHCLLLVFGTPPLVKISLDLAHDRVNGPFIKLSSRTMIKRAICFLWEPD